MQGLLRQTEQLQIQPVEQKCAVISSRSKQEALDLDLANTDAADQVGEPGGEASPEHGEASEVVVGEQLGVVCHRGWCVRLSTKD